MGRDSFEAGVTLQLESRDKTLDEYFDVTELQMQVSKDAAGQRRVVFCKDVERLLRSVAEQRQVDLDDCMVKVGMDGGGSFLKVFASLISRSASAGAAAASASGDHSMRRSGRRSATNSDFKDGGVKKLLLLAVVEDVPETHVNMQNILHLLSLESLDCVCSMDMKLANIILGLQGSSSAHPCIWCSMHRQDFGHSDRQIELRTLGSIRQAVAEYQLAAEGHARAAPLSGAAYGNCVRKPLSVKVGLHSHHRPLPTDGAAHHDGNCEPALRRARSQTLRLQLRVPSC
ncbi:MAG: hypothetical protein V2I33_16565 [Kangiellaceae bacterium]|jgi:hypothetical protein|nr:hypothetical protein [Kangiellaceae bacterium]